MRIIADPDRPRHRSFGTLGLFLLFVLFAAALEAAPLPDAAPATITVISPNGGETICPNHGEMTVSWSFSGLADGTLINVDLYKNGVITNHIFKNIPITPSTKKWDQFFASGASGEGFKVRITTADGTVSGESAAPFTLAHVPMTVKMVTPRGGEQWRLGETHRIEWSCSGCCWGVNTVTIWISTEPWDMYHNIVATISNMAPFYKGYYDWTVGDTLGGKIIPPGVKYKMEVFSIVYVPTYADAIKPDRPWLSAAPFGIYAEGAEIPPWDAGQSATGAPTAQRPDTPSARVPTPGRITKVEPRVPMVAESLKILTPAGGERWALGQTQRITWSWRGPADRPVNILLYQGSRLVGTLAKGIPAAKGVFDWKVGEAGKISAEAGDNYFVEIVTLATNTAEARRAKSPAAFSLVKAAKTFQVPVRRK